MGGMCACWIYEQDFAFNNVQDAIKHHKISKNLKLKKK